MLSPALTRSSYHWEQCLQHCCLQKDNFWFSSSPPFLEGRSYPATTGKVHQLPKVTLVTRNHLPTPKWIGKVQIQSCIPISKVKDTGEERPHICSRCVTAREQQDSKRTALDRAAGAHQMWTTHTCHDWSPARRQLFSASLGNLYRVVCQNCTFGLELLKLGEPAQISVLALAQVSMGVPQQDAGSWPCHAWPRGASSRWDYTHPESRLRI